MITGILEPRLGLGLGLGFHQDIVYGLSWIMMLWGYSGLSVIFGILGLSSGPHELYRYINGITGKSYNIRFQRGTICLVYVG